MAARDVARSLQKTGQQGAEESSREIWKNLVVAKVRSAKRGGHLDGHGVILIEQKEKAEAEDYAALTTAACRVSCSREAVRSTYLEHDT